MAGRSVDLDRLVIDFRAAFGDRALTVAERQMAESVDEATRATWAAIAAAIASDT